jgi:zinc protease
VTEVARTEIDGVPVFSLDVPGPLQCMLAFRVGVVDETLPIRGITHLVEHLAMYPLMQSGSSHSKERINARVEALRTRFFATGTLEELKNFLHDLCQSLRSLPLDRLDGERKVLRTEGANRTGGSVKACWTWRFGPSGLGLCDWEEFGLRWLGPADVERWAGEWFTAQNAVLWLSGPVPEGLTLELPSGKRKQLPAQRPLPYTTPAMYQQGDRFALLHMLGPRTSPFMLSSFILNMRLRDRIRQRESLAYEVRANYLPLDKDTAEVTAFADSLQASSKAAADAMAEETRRLGEEGPQPAELEIVRAERRRAMENPESGFGRLDASAISELEGRDSRPDVVDAEIESVTPEAMAQVVKASYTSAFLSLPQDVPMSVPGFTPIPLTSGRRYKGVQVLGMPGAGHSDVIDLSTEGISVTFPNRSYVGMAWNEIAAALWWADGRRTLFNVEGAGINFNPEKWREAPTVLGALQAHVPADRWIPMDEADALPRQDALVCSVCKASPALEVTFRNTRSLFYTRLSTVHGVLCRDCGIAEFRSVQRRLLARGWWSLPGLVYTPAHLLQNYMTCRRFLKLPVPIRTSGINPMRKGRSVLLHPAMLVPVGLVGFVVLLAHPWG